MKCDCHIHIILDGVYYKTAIEEHRDNVREEIVRNRLKSYADSGVTFLRDGGDACGASLFAKKIAGEYGIDYLSPAFPIHKKGRYGDFIGRAYETENDYLALLDKAQSDGADFIKLMLSGIMDFDEFGKLSCQPLDVDEMKMLIKHAHDRNFAVMAHVNGDQAVKNAIISGADSIEHAYYMTDDTISLLAQSDTVWVPTLSPIVNIINSGRFSQDVLTRIAEKQMLAISQAASLGAYIALGSDGGAWGVPHPICSENELIYMQKILGGGAELVLGLGSAKIKGMFRRG